MSYQERRAITSLISTILINVLYAAYMIQRYPTGDAYSVDVFRFWGAYFLILILVTIVAKIMVFILFAIINAITALEDESSITDERDKLIELRASRISFYVFGLGVVLAMVALVIDMPPAAMFIVLICAGLASEVISDMLQFYLYRRGF